MLWQLALDALGQLHRGAPRSHLAPLFRALLVLVPLCALVTGRVTRSGLAALLGALSGVALAVALSLTLFRGGFGHASLARLRTCAVTDPFVLSGDSLGNLVLFAPAAFLVALAVGRPLLVTAGVAAISLAVEGVQAVEWVGVCDSSDALHNVLGGLAAALLAAGVRATVSGSGPWPRSC